MPKQKEPTTALGAYIRSERLARQWTQGDLARQAGLPRQAVTDLEVGPATRSPDVYHVVAVAKALRRPVLRLISLIVPGQLEDQPIDFADLTLEEQEHLIDLRSLPAEERARARYYLRTQRVYVEEIAPTTPLLGPAPDPPHTT